jgi:hypothetical protein
MTEPRSVAYCISYLIGCGRERNQEYLKGGMGMRMGTGTSGLGTYLEHSTLELERHLLFPVCEHLLLLRCIRSIEHAFYGVIE